MKPTINKLTRDDIEAFVDAQLSCASFDASTLDLYQKTATKSALYPGQGSPLGLAYVALKLNGEAGELAEHVGKAMRDDGFGNGMYYDGGAVQDGGVPLTQERRALVVKEIGDVLWYLSAACNELGISLSDAALANLEKLCDRTERDALRGSGDER